MRSVIWIFTVCAVLALGACSPFSPGGESGAVRFDLELSGARQLGYDVNGVRCTMVHQVHEKTVVRYLDIAGDSATGVVRGLRVGWWDLEIELLEDDQTIGTAESEVEIVAGTPARVVLQVTLATGDLEIIVTWKNGGIILDFDFGDLIAEGLDVSKVGYTLNHYASDDTVEGEIAVENGDAYSMIPDLWVGTWNVAVTVWETGSDDPLYAAEYDLDVAPDETPGLTLEVLGTDPLQLDLRPLEPVLPYGWPDLKVAGLAGPIDATAGETIAAETSLSIANDGVGVASAAADDGSIVASFYLSETPFPGPSKELLQSVEVPTPIAANETVVVSIPTDLVVPATTNPGDYYLLVVIDEEGEVSELSELNNVDSVGLSVLPPNGTIAYRFEGSPGACFDSLEAEQCNWAVYDAGDDPLDEATVAVAEGTFTTSGGVFSHEIQLPHGVYDVYAWFDLDRRWGPTDGDISPDEISVEVGDTPVDVTLELEVVCGTVSLPDTSEWPWLDMYVALLIWDTGQQDLVDLHDAGLITDDDDRSYTSRPGHIGEDSISYVLDVTNLAVDTGVTQCFLFAYAEWDADGEFEPDTGEPDTREPFGYYGYPGQALPDLPDGANVDLGNIQPPYDFSIQAHSF